jgi:hypothetical protein
MKFSIIAIFIIISSCSGSYQKSNQYYETVIGHIVQTVISGDCNSKCINSIVNSDLKYATYAQAIYVLDQVSKKLPSVFRGVKRELSIKVEEKYKKSEVQ